ncbi:hypothetical protein QQZ08_002436 [Neonectria magnoliae]|uniref:Uncharacterized protein n=1 Tax=Neonectria magnoliae TaxID=2732573 RepID=A0ABR1IDI2_9HYPO
MDCLQGIDSSRPSPSRPTSSSEPSRRGSSISLDDATTASKDKLFRHAHRFPSDDLVQTPYNSAKSPLLLLEPEELHSTSKLREPSPEDGCPRLPSEPSLPSTPSVTSRLDVYLQDEDKYEMRMMGLRAVTPGESASNTQHLLPKNVPAVLSDSSSWQVVDSDGHHQASTSRPATRHKSKGKGRCTEDETTLPQPPIPQSNTFEVMSNLVGINPESSQSAWNIFPASPDSVRAKDRPAMNFRASRKEVRQRQRGRNDTKGKKTP